MFGCSKDARARSIRNVTRPVTAVSVKYTKTPRQTSLLRGPCGADACARASPPTTLYSGTTPYVRDALVFFIFILFMPSSNEPLLLRQT